MRTTRDLEKLMINFTIIGRDRIQKVEMHSRLTSRSSTACSARLAPATCYAPCTRPTRYRKR